MSGKSYTVVTAISVSLAISTSALPQSTLPSVKTESAIKSLSIEPSSGAKLNSQLDFQQFKVNPEKLPAQSRDKIKLDFRGQASVPLLVPNTMILQFSPEASKESIDSLIRRRNLKVVETFPNLGAVKVEGDFSKYFTPELTDNDANQALLRGITKLIEDFTKEPNVRSATPDLVLKAQAESEVVSKFMSAADVSTSAPVRNPAILDWGVKNIEADQLWNFTGAEDGVLLGVMDVGFARHDYITFLELPDKIEPADHGNHVAGIACGHHTSDRAIRGVLPNCFVRARAGNIFFNSEEGGGVLNFVVLFSQILGTMNKFFSQYDDVHVFNVSMGYNWMNNFGINPDLPEAAQWRTIVASQGAIIVSALELADKTHKVIYSAAGNDSFGLTTPVEAKFASALNWATFTARDKNIARNAVVVEAHDSANKRAAFSNVGGSMSCPGVNILSATAHDANGGASRSSYGIMSGTSMASPYCASAHLLFSLVRPGYSGSEIIECLQASTQKSDSGAPIPKLTQALAKCPAR